MGIGKKLAGAVAAMVVAGIGLSAAPTVAHAAEAKEPPEQDWKFSGLFGEFDMASVQRGLQVYLEVCSTCHSLEQLAYRNFLELGFNADEVKAIAANYEVTDGPDDNGEMFQRPAVPSDGVVSPFPNEKAARAANNGALPTDLSLLAKAHPNGPDYIYAVLTGFGEEPEKDVQIADGMNYNPYFAGGQIAMAQPLYEDSVEYTDGTEASVEQMAWDVTNFLHWAAEPEMEKRKHLGWKVILFLVVLSAILYAAKRKVWSHLH